MPREAEARARRARAALRRRAPRSCGRLSRATASRTLSDEDVFLRRPMAFRVLSRDMLSECELRLLVRLERRRSVVVEASTRHNTRAKRNL